GEQRALDVAAPRDDVEAEADEQQRRALRHRTRADRASAPRDRVLLRIEGGLGHERAEALDQGMGARQVELAVRHRQLEARGDLVLATGAIRDQLAERAPRLAEVDLQRPVLR